MNLIFVRIRLFILLSFLRLKGRVINFWNGLWFNRNKFKDPDSYIDQESEIAVVEEKEYISIFLGKNATSPIYIPKATFLKVRESLPIDYVFPSPELNKLIKDKLEQSYIEKIDQQIIEQIQKQLPQNYSLHTPVNIKPINSFVTGSKNNMNFDVESQLLKVENQLLDNKPSNYHFN